MQHEVAKSVGIFTVASYVLGTDSIIFVAVYFVRFSEGINPDSIFSSANIPSENTGKISVRKSESVTRTATILFFS